MPAEINAHITQHQLAAGLEVQLGCSCIAGFGAAKALGGQSTSVFDVDDCLSVTGQHCGVLSQNSALHIHGGDILPLAHHETVGFVLAYSVG